MAKKAKALADKAAAKAEENARRAAEEEDANRDPNDKSKVKFKGPPAEGANTLGAGAIEMVIEQI